MIPRFNSRFSDSGISCASLLASLGFLLGPFVPVVSAADKPQVERFDFGTEELGPLIPRGDVVRDQAGPRPPEFLNMDADNTAVQLKGHGARFEIKDPGPQSSYKFTNGDAITLEAWIKVESLRAGQPAYIIGKGRTLSPNFGKDNQNWSLRVVGTANGQAALSFLFTSTSGASVFHWHRWTSDATFHIAAGWHHVAVTYEFGKPETINGWIDGRPTKGKWDADGPTVDPPVVDDDDVWIGTSLKGSEGNSFIGLIDMVAIHRRRVSDQEMAGRFQRKGGPAVVAAEKPEMPKLGPIADGKVLVQFSEGLPAFDRWPGPAEMPAETDRWMNDIFLLPRVPLRYDDWGIRSDWKAPLLLRLAADVELPQGSRRFLLRARALARLWVDGVLVAETEPADASTPNGHDPVTPLAQPPLPDLRVKDYHHQEVFGTAQLSRNGPSRVVLEMVVGGKNQRTETGEMCIAVETEDGQSFSILRAGNEPGLPLTDAAVVPVLARLETTLCDLDDTNRRAAAQSRDAFWEKRHDIAREWVAQNPPSSPPKAGHPIDAFIDANIEAALASNAAASRDSGAFRKGVLPILQEKCFRCHGDKNQGGLKLNSREAALHGGDSEIPAIVPGNPDASEMFVRLRTDDASIVMPPSGERLSESQIAGLEKWIRDGAAWPAAPVAYEKLAKTAVIGDEAFLRRLYLDLIGLPPTAAEALAFLNDPTADKRTRLIDRLLADERWAEHQMADWLDLLAENPTLINASLNSTGPFRWFLFDALRDEKGLDRMVTELMMMRGDVGRGGSAGFALAGENDSPFAAKGHIIAAAFLGIELQCARCHDSPYHSTTQRDLYSLAAMLSRKTVTVPATSRVPAGFFEKKGRESLIKVTLKPDEPIAPHWSFAAATGAADGNRIDRLMDDPKDTRERFAALVTSPENRRFAGVFVNRIWKRLMGSGFVEPAHDWEGRESSHPELLDWLAGDFVAHGYAPKRLLRLIVTSAAYQREATTENLAALPANERFFSAPGRRRLTAEQIVDSLHAAAGAPIASEEITFVHDGRHTLDRRQTLGVPRRAWMFAGLNNERDRPSLALPYAQTTVDVLEAFGWNGSRQMPIFERPIEPNLLQPGILANGTLVQSLSRAAWRSELADLAVTAATPDVLVDEVFLRFLCRKPRGAEREAFLPAIREGFATRLVPAAEQVMPKAAEPLPLVTWLNHVSPEANSIQIEVEKRVRLGPPADPRLRDAWREIYEDFIWNLINDREFVWVP
jgi:mono/diheme cytochrome c family protein